MNNTIITILCGLVAAFAAAGAFPFVLRYAIKHDIVDNPNARKLQRVPVPVLGGTVVYIGILVGTAVMSIFMDSDFLLWGFIGMSIMAIIGTWDDIKDLPAVFRFVVEIFIIGAFIAITGIYIDDFHGFLGLHNLEPWFGIPLSIVSGVGIINAVNLIDGVNGYSSGYGIMTCGLFAIVFWNVWNPTLVCFAIVVAGALIPFFIHNVFGKKSKMFIGDGGTLMLGTLMAVFVFYTLWSGSKCDSMAEQENVSLLALTLAYLCIPVFDTLRVMTMRILRGKSPFNPDRTHLHHLFISMGFSHLGASMSILFINFMVVVIWAILWLSGASVDVQTFAVVLMGVLVTFGFYHMMMVQQNGGERDEEGYPEGTKLWKVFQRIGEWSHFEKGKVWMAISKMADLTTK